MRCFHSGNMAGVVPIQLHYRAVLLALSGYSGPNMYSLNISALIS